MNRFHIPAEITSLVIFVVIVLFLIWVGFQIGLLPLTWLTHPGR